ncbi:PLDc N-terminal domain-containing protein [Algoriphagus aquimarinus]|uniref:Phospholipase_D-nuclease N-terminal n=1 Tax=Algoriphagus aquimarinus TaxID=237018 RepID=A0A1I0VK18_9BACT|nr:PLDc N-terminal domain-containing protein [Algoriphagus aquimarinus]SFA76849.1 Phospholipase_D-nuclease N-terminal [Algoriphagus aquimarinus]
MNLIAPGEGLLFWQISFLFCLIYLGFWAYALFDALRSEFRAAHSKLLWVLAILFAPLIGTFLYLSMARSIRKDKRNFNPSFSKK